MFGPKFSGVLQFVQVLSNLLVTKISLLPYPGCPADEKYNVFPSAAMNGVPSSSMVFTIEPRFFGAEYVPSLCLKLTYKSLPPFVSSERFMSSISTCKSEENAAELIAVSQDKKPVLHVEFGGKYQGRPDEDIIVEEFISVKGYKAKGKRISSYEISKLEFGW